MSETIVVTRLRPTRVKKLPKDPTATERKRHNQVAKKTTVTPPPVTPQPAPPFTLSTVTLAAVTAAQCRRRLCRCDRIRNVVAGLTLLNLNAAGVCRRSRRGTRRRRKPPASMPGARLPAGRMADHDKQIAQVDGAVAVATQRGKAAAGLPAVDGQHRLGARSSMANFAHGAVLQSTGDRPDRRGAGADGKIVRVSPKNTRRFLLHVIL